MKRNNKLLETNNFLTDRGYESYLEGFGEFFYKYLTSLDQNCHWLDSGAGNCRAMFEFAIKGMTPNNITALGLVKPKKYFHIPYHNFRYLSGKYFEDYDIEEIGKCDLITDFFGPFTYTKELDLVLSKYLDLLKIGGLLFIYIKPSSLFINDKNDLRDYLNNIKNIKIEWSDNLAIDNLVFIIKKTGQINQKGIKKLKIIEYIEIAPPKRKFIYEN